MKQPMVCNYAVVRFLPYPETEEFVNVGVVLMCPRLGFFGSRLETRRRERVSNFFPELKPDIFPRGRKQFGDELIRVRKLLAKWNEGKENQLLCETGIPYYQEIFRELTRSRESIFRFGRVGTVMADEPAAELERLFAHHVERQFAQHTDFQEKIMAQRLADVLRHHNIPGYERDVMLGNDDYHVTMPFVRGTPSSRADVRAIKPLDLAREDTTRLIEHGERWIMRVKHLQDMDYRPECFLFPVRMPADAKKEKRAEDICRELRGLKANVVLFGETPKVLGFAEA